MPAEHVLTPDDKCPCGKPQEGSGYCSYECFSKFEMGSPIEPTASTASMGGPLSEAERAGANHKHRPVADGGPIRDDRLDEIREEAGYANVTVDADELLWLLNERDRLESDNEELSIKWAGLSEERIRRENAEKTLRVLEGQLATARELHQPKTVHGIVFCGRCLKSQSSIYGKTFEEWPCADAIALGLDGGDPDGTA